MNITDLGYAMDDVEDGYSHIWCKSPHKYMGNNILYMRFCATDVKRYISVYDVERKNLLDALTPRGRSKRLLGI